MSMCIASSGEFCQIPMRHLRFDRLTDKAVAELVSAYPTAGGMYFVTKYVVPPEKVPIWAWIVGWCNFLGQTAGVSSVAYSVSQMLLACVSMNSKFENGHYQYSPYVTTTSKLRLDTDLVL